MTDGVFLDEPTDHIRLDDGRSRGPSPFEFFADEGSPSPVSAPLALDVPYEVVALPTIRPGLLFLFFFVAAIAAFAMVRACQVQGLSPLAIWHLLQQ